MLIIGAKGFAKEVLEILHQNNELDNLSFYDDLSVDFPDILFDKFPVVKSEVEAKNYLKKTNNQYTLGVGNPKLREKLHHKFEAIGGEFTSTISRFAEIGSYDVKIGQGCNILGGARISNNAKIGKGCIIYYNCIITHDVIIGDFCEISPGATLLGCCEIGKSTQIGAGAIIFPSVKIGNNCIIAAGAVVRENIPDNCMVAGIPAVIKKQI